MEFLKKNWLVVSFIFFVLLSLVFYAIFAYKAISKSNQADKVIMKKTDTIRSLTQVTQPTVYLYGRDVYQIHDTERIIVRVPVEYQAVGNEEELKKKLNSLSQKYFTLKNYIDTIHLKDSLGNNVGFVNIKDRITENTLQPRDVNYSLKFPKETITVTNTLMEKPRRKVLIGIEAVYTTIKPLNSAGVALIYQDRQNRLFKVGGGQMFGTNQQYISAGTYIPISFRKKQ